MFMNKRNVRLTMNAFINFWELERALYFFTISVCGYILVVWVLLLLFCLESFPPCWLIGGVLIIVKCI